MLKFSYEEIVHKIIDEKGISEQDIEAKVKEKLEKLSGLLSRDGAIHIVANEFGVSVFDTNALVTIKKLQMGMNLVHLYCKVVRLGEIKSFTKNEKTSKVCNLFVGDQTSFCRVVLWDANLINLVENKSIQEGSILFIKNGYVKENNGYNEIHLGNKGVIEINPQGVSIELAEKKEGGSLILKKIKDFGANESGVSCFGTLVQLFDLRSYNACSQCGKKVDQLGETFTCKEHGKVSVQVAPILNFYFDDGTGVIRTTAFKESVKFILEQDDAGIKQLLDTPVLYEEHKSKILGKQILLTGRVVTNEQFNRKEFSVFRVQELTPQEVLEKVIKT